VAASERCLTLQRSAIESLEPSKISKKMQKVQMIKLKKDLAEFFNQTQEKYGMGFFPEGIGNNIDIDEAVEKVMKSPIDEMEEYGLDLINDIINRNRLERPDDAGVHRLRHRKILRSVC
jgi:hypothetical protein